MSINILHLILLIKIILFERSFFMFRLHNVTYKHILNISNLTILPNKVTCIVGTSGSGKTTLLKLLNKMITCDSGEIYYNDTNISNINSIELRRKVIMLPQLPVIYKGTVRDNLLISLKFVNKPMISDTVLSKTLSLVSLNKSLDELADKLSGGEKQRLALSRILLLNPDVFLLDEPSSSLDDLTEQIIIQQLVTYVRSNKKTLIMVTHSNNVAEKFADTIIHVDNGKINIKN